MRERQHTPHHTSARAAFPPWRRRAGGPQQRQGDDAAASAVLGARRLVALLAALLATLLCCSPNTLPPQAAHLAPSRELAQAEPLAPAALQIEASPERRGVCLLRAFDQGRRALIAHTDRPCPEARFERGDVELWETTQGRVLAKASTWLQGDPEGGWIIVRDSPQGPEAVLRMSDGQRWTPQSARQARGQRSVLRLILSPGDHALWIFEAVERDAEVHDLYVERVALDAASWPADPVEPTRPALFWPEDGLDTIAAAADGGLLVERTSSPAGAGCARAAYPKAGDATCALELDPIHDHRVAYASDGWRITQHKARATLQGAPSGRPLAPLHEASCSPGAVRMPGQDEPPHVLYQCSPGDRLELWTPRGRLAIPGDRWQLLPSSQTRWHTLLARSAQTTTRALVDLRSPALWTLPQDVVLATQDLALRRSDGVLLHMTQPPGQPLTLQPLTQPPCPAQTQRLVMWSHERWAAARCADAQPAPALCPRPPQTSPEPSGLAATTLYDLAAARRLELDSAPAAPPVGPWLIVAQGASFNEREQLCPARALRWHRLAQPAPPNPSSP